MEEKKKDPYWQGFEAAEYADPRGRRANPYEYPSLEWKKWEEGYSSYLSARAEMYEDYYDLEEDV